MENTRKTLVVHHSKYAAGQLAEFLEEELTDVLVEVSHTLADARAKLKKDPDYRWLITQESLPDKASMLRGSGGSDEPDGMRLARCWVEDGTHNQRRHRAIVLTKRCWDNQKVQFTESLFGIPECRLSSYYHYLIDMINAAEVGSVLAPPTVFRYLFDKEGDDCKVTLMDISEGPLQVLLQNRLRGSLSVPEVYRFQAFDKHFPRILNPQTPTEKRRRLVVETAKRIGKGLSDSGMLPTLLNANSRACEKWGFRDVGVNGPFAIHLQLVCKGGMLRQMVDVALRGKSTGDHLCAKIPVVWRLPVEATSQHDEQRECNPIRYSQSGFRAVFSCDDKFSFDGAKRNGISDVEQETKLVLESVGLPASKSQHVENRKDVRLLFCDHSGSAIHAVHTTTHGIHRHPGDESGIVVGPVGRKSGGIASLVTVLELPNTSQASVRFAFFNCCSLGHQDAEEDCWNSYHGSFAEGVIVGRVSDETVCNRWPVKQQAAFKLGREFYVTRPRTVHGRAAALLRARLKLLEDVEVGGMKDSTWLAPIHVWAWPEVPD